MRDQNIKLTRITIRAEQISANFPPMISEEEQANLDYDPLEIAKLEEKRKLLSYIHVQ